MGNLKNLVYSSIIELCEELEKKKEYIGNGHHLAQEIVNKIETELKKRGNSNEIIILDEYTYKNMHLLIESQEENIKILKNIVKNLKKSIKNVIG